MLGVMGPWCSDSCERRGIKDLNDFPPKRQLRAQILAHRRSPPPDAADGAPNIDCRMLTEVRPWSGCRIMVIPWADLRFGDQASGRRRSDGAGAAGAIR
jgi:hypothetical protein